MAADAPAGHVVVIDDAPDLLDLYGVLLGDEGYRVTPLRDLADDPAEVLRLAPDLIVLDLLYAHEPRGLPFLRRLRADPAGAAVPVIVASGAAETLRENAAELHDLGAEPLAKPFDLDDLLARAWRLRAQALAARDQAAAAVAAMREAAEWSHAVRSRMTNGAEAF
jgi:DNA-binding response OmpR family regulator